MVATLRNCYTKTWSAHGWLYRQRQERDLKNRILFGNDGLGVMIGPNQKLAATENSGQKQPLTNKKMKLLYELLFPIRSY